MTQRGAPVVWLGKARDTTYRSKAKKRCRCGVEIPLDKRFCCHACECFHTGRRRRW